MEKTTFISVRGIDVIATAYKNLIDKTTNCTILVHDPVIVELFAINGLSEIILPNPKHLRQIVK